ncbi:translation initiation factor IF-2 [Dysgonomonadaceae bacterium PH5-43]|nr:translation initiation factor IF-2 [Dysgonomonadaceae bacterium PH5-43]
MSIRLNKVTKNLNVGLTTVVSFLNAKGHPTEENPNTKISDEEYEMLVREFSKDKNLKLESEKISQERSQKEKKVSVAVDGYKEAKEEIKVEVPEEAKPKFVVKGKLDLDSLEKKKKTTKKPVVEKKKEETPIENKEETKEIKETITVPKSEEIAIKVEQTQKMDELQEEITTQTKKEAVIDKPETMVEQPEALSGEAEQGESAEDSGVFRLSSPQIKREVKVLGSIDLTSINSSTRPKKKTKEEKKKERAEKNKKTTKPVESKKVGSDNAQPERTDKPLLVKKGDVTGDAKKAKRNRIQREKIDIEKGVSAPKPESQKLKLRKPAHKAEVSDEDVQKQIKETLARLTNKGQKKGAKYRKEKREANRQEQFDSESEVNNTIKITEFVTANELANMMNIPVIQVISTCMSVGIMVSINQRLDAETINLVAEEFGYKTEYVSAEVVEAINEEEDREEDLLPRSPIVTVMGHVDHGKTSLLDNVRNTNVIAGEAGGITQHIGAYNVKLADGRKITFLDTPGHEAFTAMRARGASVTDIAIIIVAADDNVMPQTKEAINHAAAANVPIVFAINKIDKPGANPEKIKETLASMNYLVEDWGGKYQSQDISAKQGIGVPELLEKVLLEAELLDLKANPNRKAVGSVIESSLDKGRGYVVTVLVQNGTLKQGDVILAGTHYGRVKAMFNERNQRITEAGPAEPVLILGLNGAPQAGDVINVMETEQEARDIATKREQLQREQGLRTQKLLTLDDIGRRIAIGNFQQLNIIVKGDVDGSVEALSDSLINLSTEQIQVNVIHKGVGQISESDIILAAASDAIIVGFQVRPSQAARKLADKEGVDVRLYSIIYDTIEEVKAAMEGMLSPEIKEEITANVEVQEVFKITKVGTVAGCLVREGKIKRGNKIRIIRDGIVVYAGELGSLKRFKEDVKEVSQGYECGLNIHNYNDIKVGDIVEAYEETEVKQKL